MLAKSSNSASIPVVEPQVEQQPNKRQKITNASSKSNEKLDRMTKKLKGAQFRWLNEKLYTQDGKDSFKEFQKDPQLFEIVRNLPVDFSTIRDFERRAWNGH